MALRSSVLVLWGHTSSWHLRESTHQEWAISGVVGTLGALRSCADMLVANETSDIPL
jgi:hypothetical protein